MGPPFRPRTRKAPAQLGLQCTGALVIDLKGEQDWAAPDQTLHRRSDVLDCRSPDPPPTIAGAQPVGNESMLVQFGGKFRIAQISNCLGVDMMFAFGFLDRLHRHVVSGFMALTPEEIGPQDAVLEFGHWFRATP